MTIDEIRALIRNPDASAADLRQAAAAADDVIKGSDAAVDALEARRQDLLLEVDAGAKVKKLDEQIRNHNLQSEICVAAKAKLAELIKEAGARELLADIESNARQGYALTEEMKAIYADLDLIVAETVVPSLQRLMDLEVELRAVLNFVAHNGRSDLKPKWPLVQLGEHLNWPSDRLPQVNLWSLHGYWPLASRTRHQLDGMKDLAPELSATEAVRNLLNREVAVQPAAHPDDQSTGGLLSRMKEFIK